MCELNDCNFLLQCNSIITETLNSCSFRTQNQPTLYFYTTLTYTGTSMITYIIENLKSFSDLSSLSISRNEDVVNLYTRMKFVRFHRCQEIKGFINLITCNIKKGIFLAQFCPMGKGAMKLALSEATICETRADHNTRNSAPYAISQ